MDQRLSIVTLGVTDMAATRAFYERLGWQASGQSNENVTFFQAGSVIFGLYGHAALAQDTTVKDAGVSAFRGVSLAYTCRDKAGVDAALEEAKVAGPKIIKNAEEVFWGGYFGYFADPDGHLWEIAYNPYFVVAADGSISLPD